MKNKKGNYSLFGVCLLLALSGLMGCQDGRTASMTFPMGLLSSLGGYQSWGTSAAVPVADACRNRNGGPGPYYPFPNPNHTNFFTFLGGSGYDSGRAVCALAEDNGMLVVGDAGANIAGLQGMSPPLNPYSGGSDGLLVKLKQSGDVEWYTFLGSPNHETLWAVTRSPADDGFILTGKASQNIPLLHGRVPIVPMNPASFGAGWVVKIDKTGSVQWHTFIGGPTYNGEIRSIVPTANGGYILSTQASTNIPVLQGKTPIIPHSGGVSGQEPDGLVVRLDGSGNVQWYTFIGSHSAYDTLYQVTESPDGGYVLVGSAGGSIPVLQGIHPLIPYSAPAPFTLPTDGLIVKLRETGDVEWYTFIGTSDSEILYAVTLTDSGDFYAVGLAQADIPSLSGMPPVVHHSGAGADSLIVKVNTEGKVLWYRFLGWSGGQVARGVTTDFSDAPVLTGFSTTGVPVHEEHRPKHPFTNGFDNGLVVGLKADGTLDWFTFVGQYTLDIKPSGGGGFAVVGPAGNNINLYTINGVTPNNAHAPFDDMMLINLGSTGIMQ